MTDETHHSTEQDLIQHRLDKLERIRARGQNPYRHSFERSSTIGPLRDAFEVARGRRGDPYPLGLLQRSGGGPP